MQNQANAGFGKENFLEQLYALLKLEIPFSCERKDDAFPSGPWMRSKT